MALAQATQNRADTPTNASRVSAFGEIRTLTPTIGAELLGVDLSKITPELIAYIRAALLDHCVVFFRDQDLTVEQLVALGSTFGKLHIQPGVKHPFPEMPEVLLLESDENTKVVGGGAWHTDTTAAPEPPLGAILHMIQVPANGGGDTIWANTYASYEALSPAMKAFLADKTAVHNLAGVRELYNTKDDDPTRRFSAEHPVVRTHPETKRKSLFVNGVYTSHIVQLEKAESDAVLAMLYKHMENPVFQCRFKWRPGSVAFWDNRCTMHLALGDYNPHRRLGYRVAIYGDKPF